MSRLVRLLVGVVALSGALSAVPAHGQASEFSATVTGVLDEAVLQVQPDEGPAMQVQLAGIFTNGGGGQVCGADAAQSHLLDLVGGQTVRVQPDGNVTASDGNATVSGWVFLVDGRNLAEVLIREGDVYRDASQVPGPLTDALTAAQAQAAQDGAGLWAAGACQSADNAGGNGRLSGFVNDTGQALQEASLAINVLRQQALSARQVGSTPSWQQTTSTAVNWAHHAATRLTQTSSDAPLAPELVQLGGDLQNSTADFAAAASSPDDLQVRASQLVAIGARVSTASGEVSALARSYGVGD